PAARGTPAPRLAWATGYARTSPFVYTGTLTGALWPDLPGALHTTTPDRVPTPGAPDAAGRPPRGASPPGPAPNSKCHGSGGPLPPGRMPRGWCHPYAGPCSTIHRWRGPLKS